MEKSVFESVIPRDGLIIERIAQAATPNLFMVGVNGRALVILNRDAIGSPLTRDGVLNLCAWLLTMVEALDVKEPEPITEEELFVACAIAKGALIEDVREELAERLIEHRRRVPPGMIPGGPPPVQEARSFASSFVPGAAAERLERLDRAEARVKVLESRIDAALGALEPAKKGAF